jgi:hypothetical protein
MNRWDGRRGRRRLAAGLVAALLAMPATGCAAFSTGDDEQRARELAEELFPGELTVIGARILFPESTGSEITFSVVGNPDAVVRLRIDAAKNRCEGRTGCAAALRKAVGQARRDAARMRTMLDAFENCGYRVLATDEKWREPWVEAQPTNADVGDVVAGIGACVQRWVTAGARRQATPLPRWVSVQLAAPQTVRGLPAAKHTQPTSLRLSDRRRLAALEKRPYYVISYPFAQDDAHRVDTASAQMRIVSPLEVRQAFSRRVEAGVLPQLRATYPHAVTTGGAGLGVWMLQPGTVDRVRGRVLFCRRPPADGKRCMGDAAAVVIADADGDSASVTGVLTDIRDEHGVVRLPPL